MTGEVDQTVLDAKPQYLYHFKKVLILTDDVFCNGCFDLSLGPVAI